MNIPVVYEDEWLLIADKPAGLLVIPAPGKEGRTLTGILNEDLQDRGLLYRLHPCHRLDRETSGLIIYAKGKSVQKKMMDEFRYRKVEKTYLAFVQGSLHQGRGEIRSPVGGLSALTRYKIIQKRQGFTIVEVKPLTGRTNQIRIHFKGVGHPLVGETKFAFRRDSVLKAKRVCLHAQSLEFIHPMTKQAMRIEAGLPGDLGAFLERHTV